MKKNLYLSFLFFVVFSSFFLGCSTPQPVKSQAYAKLNNERTFENEFPVVWKGIEESLRKYKVVNRDPSDVDPLELQKLTRRTLESDWIYTQSRDKYTEYKVNGSPRKIYLQTRYKYYVDARKVIGGVHVTVKTDEEVERLNADGTPAGYTRVDEPDTSRTNELLEKIQMSILSAAP